MTGDLVGLPLPAAVIVHELAAAEAVLSTSPGRRCHRYAAGVLEALMWAEMATPGAAIPGSPVREPGPGRPRPISAVSP